MQVPIRVGVVGYGMASRVMHLPFLTTMKEFQVVSILERHQSLAKGKYPWINTVRSIDELLEDKNIDLVVITTPNETHFDYAKKSVLSGKHVVVEKPFTIHSEEAKELINLSSKFNRIVSVYQNRRYVNHFLTIKKILHEQLLGDIAIYEGRYERFRPGPKPNAWREEDQPGAGILYDLGAHLLDQTLCLFGLPISVTADARMQRSHAKAVDFFDIRLDYGFNQVTLKADMLAMKPGPRYTIHGLKGSYVKYEDDPQEALLKDGKLPGGPGWGEESISDWGSLYTESNGIIVEDKYPSVPGNYGSYYLNLYNTIVHGAPLLEKPEHGYNSVRMIELAIESSKKRATINCTSLMPVAYP